MTGSLEIADGDDAKLRAENPGLNELWEKYQTMLTLCRPATPAPDNSAADMLALIRNRNQDSNIMYQELERDQKALDKRREELEK